MRALAVSVVLAVAPAAAHAQHGHQHRHGPASPYAGIENRPVKALSEEQVADLRAGRGMGLALPAELNGYPGPMHVLELADSLALTPEQRARVQELFDAMKAQAVGLGERLIAQETELERLFAERRATSDALASAATAIAATQGQLRIAHLRHHVETAGILTPEQAQAYRRLRGYAAGP